MIRAAAEGGAGWLWTIGVMSDKRSTVFPDLPAVGETVPGFDISWGKKIREAGIQPEWVRRR